MLWVQFPADIAQELARLGVHSLVVTKESPVAEEVARGPGGALLNYVGEGDGLPCGVLDYISSSVNRFQMGGLGE